MTREYDIKNAAWDYFQDLDSHHFQILPHCNPQTDAFEAGAKWADETMIDKVCEWLDKVDTDGYMDSGIFQMSVLIADLKEELKRE